MGSRSFEAKAILGLYTETPLHCGSESGAGLVDLPIQRERHSHFPVIPGSTIKGVLRDEMRGGLGPQVDEFFGSPDAATPGTISFGDGFLLAFPVRAASVPFAWVTCPMVLERTYRAMKTACPDMSGLKSGNGWASPGAELRGDVLLEDVVVKIGDAPQAGSRSLFAIFEQLLPDHDSFQYTRSIFPRRIVCVPDHDFEWLVESATEVVTRIKLDDDTKTTSGERGHMFNEELVPRDALFASVFRELSAREFPLRHIPETIRLGGDETIGRGVTWVKRHFLPGN